MDWAGNEALREYVAERQAVALRTYEVNPDLLEEHVNQEDSFRSGGYGRRQISELLQNAVDALTASRSSGTIEFRIADNALYCANQGEAFDEKGIRSICAAFLSSKREEDIIGRFGLGFKAVLGISDNPQIFSRSVSLEFNGAATAELFGEMAAPDGRFPLMRVPSALDPTKCAARDPHLAELMTWATTVVKLPLTRDGARMRAELKEFETESLLFMRSVSQLNITLQGASGTPLVLSHRREGNFESGEVTLHRPDGDAQEWLYAERQYEAPESVLKTLTAVTARSSMTVSYAVQKNGSSATLGQIWAWFPLRDRTTARGIFNAPWQVNDDRTTLLSASVLNTAMLEVCGELFIDVVARASTQADPAAHLDLFPARGREERSAADRQLSSSIPRLARLRKLIPDSDGVLRNRDFFRGVPALNVPVVPPDLVEKWQRAVGRTTMPHPSAFTTARDRFSRLRALLRDDDSTVSKYETSVGSWLSELALARTPRAVATALEILIELREAGFTSEILGSSLVIPLANDEWGAAGDHRTVLIPRVGEPVPHGVTVIDPDLVNDLTRPLFQKAGFSEVSTDQTASALGAAIRAGSTDDEWQRLWAILNIASPKKASEILNDIREREIDVKVRTRTDLWASAGEVFAEEGIAPSDDLRHASFFHAGRVDLLRLAGCLDGPNPQSNVSAEPVYEEYRTAMVARVEKQLADAGHRLEQLLLPDEPAAGPLQLLVELSNDAAFVADWTVKLLHILPSKSTMATFTVDRSSKQNSIEVPTPDWWALTRHGRVVTSLGLARLGHAVSSTLRQYAKFLPVVDTETSMYLESPRTLDRVHDSVLGGFLAREGYDPESLKLFTDVLVEAIHRDRFAATTAIPAVLNGKVVIRPAIEVVIVSSDDDIDLLEEHGIAYVDGRVDGADDLAGRLKLRTSADALSRSLEIREAGPEVPILDRFPSLENRSNQPLGRIRLQTSAGIIRQTTSPSGVIPHREMSARLYDVIVLDDSLDDSDTLKELSERLGLGLTSSDIIAVLRDDESLRRNDLILRSKSSPDDAARLLLLVGARVLKTSLPQGLLGAVEAKIGKQTELEIAELFRRVKGFDSLWSLRDELRNLGLSVPTNWAGSDQAQAFVVSLGFVSGYAGTKEIVRPALQQVQGRLDLAPLHAFQKELAEKVRSLTLNRDEKGDIQRGLLYLPTGAGKTRVTVEAVVRMFVANELSGPVLWIAQSQELCEQAIQTWTDAWRAFGDERVLDINRFWGNYEVDESNEELQIVVASDDKLNSRIEADPDTYVWLAKATLVIIDEAHTALSPTYTTILRWLGLTASRIERPLLGLTATPYRGRNPEINERFVMRFGKNKLESLDPEDPIGQLRREQVLAEVDHYVLDGSVVSAEGNDRVDFLRMKEVSKTMLDRIGQDMERTQTVVDDIMSKDETWPILVFAASVSSAHTIAALLRLEGKAADAVDGSMRPQERRRIIQDFRSGRTQILINCDLLTQGFDAPKVRALYIARPTFSPNRYHQMIGRGLRGPKNGGTERCLIVNIADTFEEFGETLAFTDFNYLWEGK
jgi:superfamily II DNA or RNA helicase